MIAEHEVILAAIEARNGSSAEIAMDCHLEGLLDSITATQSINPEFFDRQS